MIAPELLAFINRLCPEHDRTSCSDEKICNAIVIPEEEFIPVLEGRCARCSLLYLASNPDKVLPDTYETQGQNLLAYLN